MPLSCATNSVTLAAGGGPIGVALGTATGAAFAASQGWPYPVEPRWLGAVVTLAAVVGAVARLYPAGCAARLQPADAIRPR